MTNDEKQKLLTESKTFCMMPFIHMYLNTDGNVLPCCTGVYDQSLGNVRNNTIKEIWNNEEYKNLRKNIINGNQVPHCQVCYLHGNASKSDNSFRQWANRDFKDFIDVVDHMEPDGFMKEMPLKYFDVRFSNVCNFKCRTCADLFSTSWALEDRKFFKSEEPVQIHVSNNDPYLLEQFKPFLPNMHVIYFAGGEPLITPEHYEVLEYLIEQKSTQMLLRYNSNMSVLSYKGKNVIPLWNQFEKVDLFASLDSWGERAEYIRHGCEWKTVVSNLKKVKKEAPHVIIDFNSVISLFNVVTITEFLDELINEGLLDPFTTRSTLYRAITPDALTMRVLDQKTKDIAKEKIIKWLAQFDQPPHHLIYLLNDVVAFIDEDHSHLQKKSKERIDHIDHRRNESFYKTFPELREWYDNIR